MADYLTTDTELTSVANAIRTKGGTSSSLVYPAGFVSAINDITTGGATITDTTDSHGGTIRSIDTENATTVTSLSVTENGTYTATSGTAYNPVTVNVSGGSTVKTINGHGVNLVSVNGWTMDDICDGWVYHNAYTFGWIEFLGVKYPVSFITYDNDSMCAETANGFYTFESIGFRFDFNKASLSEISAIHLEYIYLDYEEVTSEYADSIGDWQINSIIMS